MSSANRTNGHGAIGDPLASVQPEHLELKRGGFVAGYPPFEYLELEDKDKMWKKERFGLYLHLPYCRKRCTFCFYKVYTNRNALPMEEYLDALHKEIDFYGAKPELQGRIVNTIYWGGGTPTTLSPEQMRALAAKLRERFTIASDAEWTVEGEPGTLDYEKATALREIGVTRLSLGVQSFDDALLDRNGRSHGVSHALRAMAWARELKYPVVNIDLMSGMIDETAETWDRSLETLIGLSPEHVSVYRMEVYKNSLLYAAGYTGPGVGGIPTDEQEMALWHHAVDRLEGAGYTQVNGHAFVKAPEYDHVQRVDNWGSGELLGLGVSSYSYLNRVVFQNSAKWETYVERAGAGGSAVQRSVRLSSRGVMAREVVLGLKKLRFDRAAFAERHGFDVVELYGPRIKALEADGALRVTDDAITLTRRGRDYVEMICTLFYLPEHNELRFRRLATEDELEDSAALQLSAAPIAFDVRMPLTQVTVSA
jgi:oxygen-independent coproporphyrinogen-3 oxidase